MADPADIEARARKLCEDDGNPPDAVNLGYDWRADYLWELYAEDAERQLEEEDQRSVEGGV
jgi:hypothetical protein